MAHCPTCSAPVSEGRFCSSCGGALAPPGEAPTRTSMPEDTPERGARREQEPPTRTSARVPHRSYTSGSISEGRFLPGAMLAGRYRIVGLLGEGGMGEVYRADDLKLGQPVALKFLPQGFEKEPGRLQRLLGEVRTARQVSHANVCRVFDIGEVDGQHFLSMEYVDGEDLSSLLRRIGRLPKDKAVQIARQLCAGLAASHDQGILHRDLKPANIMIDGRGRVRITDFGLAALGREIDGAEARQGTPAYMAPEQIAGRAVTVRSDIYALGLVLYELFTGKRAFDASTLPELARLHQEATPTSPSSHVEGFDPAVERVILRCLEKDPGQRPASALAVAAALPGGDPLAAALAAGETPSPEMVADAEESGLLKVWVAGAFLAAILLAWIAGFVITPIDNVITDYVSLPRTPQALADEAAALAVDLGYDEAFVDSEYRFAPDKAYLDHLIEQDSSDQRWEPLRRERPAAVTFWYRSGPRALIGNRLGIMLQSTRATQPPLTEPGMIRVRLDPRGHLLEFIAVPPRVGGADEEMVTDPPDWNAMFAKADLDPGQFSPVRPIWNPPLACDERVAWTGFYADLADLPVRVEGCRHRSRIAAFRVLMPWQMEELQAPDRGPAGSAVGTALNVTLYLLAIVGGGLLAWRNIRLGRGDRRGALRFAAFILFAGMMVWLFDVTRLPATTDRLLPSLQVSVAKLLLQAGQIWVFYMGIEPLVRRRWPGRIVSWTRLLAGRWRDPLVGRDVLIGLFAGIVSYRLLANIAFFLQRNTSVAPPIPGTVGIQILGGFRHVLGEIFNQLFGGIYTAIFFTIAALVIQIVVRKVWLAVPILWALMSTVVVTSIPGWNPALAALASAITGVFLFTTIRYGMIAGAMTMFSAFLMFEVSLRPDFSSWRGLPDVTIIATLTTLALAAFYFSLAGRSVVKGELLGE